MSICQGEPSCGMKIVYWPGSGRKYSRCGRPRPGRGSDRRSRRGRRRENQAATGRRSNPAWARTSPAANACPGTVTAPSCRSRKGLACKPGTAVGPGSPRETHPAATLTVSAGRRAGVPIPISRPPAVPGRPARSVGRPARRPGSARGAGHAARIHRRSSCRSLRRPPAAAW